MKLIDAIKIQAQCGSESELKDLPHERKEWIAKLIEERVPSGLAPLDEWNEAIACFTHGNPEGDNDQAKRKLLSILRDETKN